MVRRGGLDALQRVTHDNSEQREIVLKVICAYLRGPYVPPPEQPAARRTGLPAAVRRSIAADRVAASAAAARRMRLAPPSPNGASEQVRYGRNARYGSPRNAFSPPISVVIATRPPASRPIRCTALRATTSTSPAPAARLDNAAKPRLGRPDRFSAAPALTSHISSAVAHNPVLRRAG